MKAAKPMTENQRRLALAKYQQIKNAAYRAVMARARLEELIDKAKQDRAAWLRMCEASGASIDGDYSDWMC